MQTNCSACAMPMKCDANENRCWCQDLPVLPTNLYNPTQGCLCAVCLLARQSASAGVVVYGIANCDTVKKACNWLITHAIPYTFWDYKKQAVPSDLLMVWLVQHGWQAVCNTRGTTWRKLPEALKVGVCDVVSAHTVLINNASAIKRPIVMWGEAYNQRCSIGFDAALWTEWA
jgi:Spx/MgsR family transcriptional regulator